MSPRQLWRHSPNSQGVSSAWPGLQPWVPLPAGHSSSPGHKSCWHQPGGAAVPSCSLELPLTRDRQLHSSSFPGISLPSCKMLWPKHSQELSHECSEQVLCVCVCVCMQMYTQNICALIDLKNSLQLPFYNTQKCHFQSINREQRDP